MEYDLLEELLDSICEYFVEELSIFAHKAYQTVILSSSLPLSLSLYNVFAYYQGKWLLCKNYLFVFMFLKSIKKIINHLNNFTTNRSIRLFQFILIQSWKTKESKILLIHFRLSSRGIKMIIVTSYYHLNFCIVCYDALFNFWFWFLGFFFFVSLASGASGLSHLFAFLLFGFYYKNAYVKTEILDFCSFFFSCSATTA